MEFIYFKKEKTMVKISEIQTIAESNSSTPTSIIKIAGVEHYFRIEFSYLCNLIAGQAKVLEIK